VNHYVPILSLLHKAYNRNMKEIHPSVIFSMSMSEMVSQPPTDPKSLNMVL